MQAQCSLSRNREVSELRSRFAASAGPPLIARSIDSMFDMAPYIIAANDALSDPKF